MVPGAGGVAPRPTGGLQGVRKKNPPVTAAPCQPPLGKGPRGRGRRIATAGVRTGFTMTGFLQGGVASSAVCGGTHGCHPTEADG